MTEPDRQAARAGAEGPGGHDPDDAARIAPEPVAAGPAEPPPAPAASAPEEPAVSLWPWLALALGLGLLAWGLRSFAYHPGLPIDFALSGLCGLGLIAWAWPRLPGLETLSRPLLRRIAQARTRARAAADAGGAEAPPSAPADLDAPEALPEPFASPTGSSRASDGRMAFVFEAASKDARIGALLLALAIGLALLGQLRLDAAALAGGGVPTGAAVFLLLAALVWIAGLGRGGLKAPPDRALPIRPGPAVVASRRQGLLLGLGLVIATGWLFPMLFGNASSPLSLMRYGSAYDNSITPLGGAMWIAGTLICAWSLVDRRPILEAWRRLRTGPWLRLELGPTQLWLLLILLIAAWFRFHDLANLPYEMTSDHTEKLGDIRSIIEGLRPAFLPGNAGREAFEFYWIALLVRAGLPLSFSTMKIGMGLVSLATVPAVYLLGRELAGRKAGLFAALILALAPWHLQITRAALRIAFAPLFAAIALWLCLRALRVGGRNAWLALGLSCGLGVYGYTAFRPVLIAVPLIVLAKLLHDAWSEGRLGDPRRWMPRDLAVHLASGVTLGILVIAPVLRYAADWPEFFNGRSRSRLVGDYAPLDQFWPLLRQNLSEQLLPNIKNALLMFNFTSDSAWFQSPPGRPALETVGAAFLVLGVVTALYRLWQRDWRSGALLAALPLTLITTILALAFPRENPSLSRASAALPIVVVLAALPPALVLPAFWRGLGRRGQAASGLMLLLLFLWMGRGAHARYFDEYRRSYDKSTHSTRQGAEVARGFVALGGDLEHVYYVGWVHGWDYRALAWLMDAPDWRNILQGQAEDWSDAAEPARSHVADPARKLYLVGGSHADRHRKLLRELFPDAIETYHRTRVPGKEFWSIYVPGEAAGAEPETDDDG